jgi:hypothetical protein
MDFEWTTYQGRILGVGDLDGCSESRAERGAIPSWVFLDKLSISFANQVKQAEYR